MNFRPKAQTHSAIHVPLFFAMEKKSCQGLTRNISFNGVLLHNHVGSISKFRHGDVGKCQFFIGNTAFNIRGQVLRRVGNDLAIRFIDLCDDDTQSLSDIINARLGERSLAVI